MPGLFSTTLSRKSASQNCDEQIVGVSEDLALRASFGGQPWEPETGQ